MISGRPQFEDDKDLLPLQAADMLAWHLRKAHEVSTPPRRLPESKRVLGNPHMFSEITEAELQGWADNFSRLPAIPMMRSKSQWRAVKRGAAQLHAAGFIPPHGTRMKNALHRAREFLARLIYS